MRTRILALVLLAACHGQKEAPVPDSAEAATRAPPSSADGAAYLSVRGVGLVRIAGAAITVVHADTRSARAVGVAPGGAIYALFEDRLVRADASGASVVSTRVPAVPNDLAIATRRSRAPVRRGRRARHPLLQRREALGPCVRGACEHALALVRRRMDARRRGPGCHGR